MILARFHLLYRKAIPRSPWQGPYSVIEMGNFFTIPVGNSSNNKADDPKIILTDTLSFVSQEWTTNLKIMLLYDKA